MSEQHQKSSEKYVDPFEQIIKSIDIEKTIKIMEDNNLSIQDVMAELFMNARYTEFIPEEYKDKYYSYIAMLEQNHNEYCSKSVEERIEDKRKKLERKIDNLATNLIINTTIPLCLSITALLYGTFSPNTLSNYKGICKPKSDQVEFYDKIIVSRRDFLVNKETLKCELPNRTRLSFYGALGFLTVASTIILSAQLRSSSKTIAKYIVDKNQEDN